MSNVYEIIESLRNWKGYTLREVTQRAGITYTTLASIMSRRSPTISKRILTKVAAAFDVEWYVLLNCKNEKEPGLLVSGRFSDEPRLATDLSETDVKQVLHKIIGDGYMEYMEVDRSKQTTGQPKDAKRESAHNDDLRRQFKQSIDFVLNKLNDEGLMEAMRRVLDIANDPAYRMNKEENEWQKEGLPMAAERLESEQMDDTKR